MSAQRGAQRLLAPETRTALEGLLNALEATNNYAAAKATDLWENLRRGGDWDLLVRDRPRALRAVVEAVGEPNRLAVWSHGLGCYYPWGEIDLLDGVRYRGVLLLSSSEAVEAATHRADGIVAARPAHVAISACLLPAMAYGTHKAEYELEWKRAQARDRHELRRVLEVVLGTSLAERVERDGPLPHLSHVRRAFMLRSAVSRSAWAGAIKYAVVEVAQHARPPAPPAVLVPAAGAASVKAELERLEPAISEVMTVEPSSHAWVRRWPDTARVRRRGGVVLVERRRDWPTARRQTPSDVVAAYLATQRRVVVGVLQGLARP